MNATETRCLDAFPVWLEQLAADALELLACLESEEPPPGSGMRIAAALNYLLKSLDLIPDGVEELGMLDDAFVLRVAVAKVPSDAPQLPPVVSRFAQETELIESLLADDFPRLVAYVDGLEELEVRGRLPADIVEQPEVRAALANEVRAWANGYRAPRFSRDEKNLIKLRSFLRTKLPKIGSQGGLPGI